MEHGKPVLLNQLENRPGAGSAATESGAVQVASGVCDQSRNGLCPSGSAYSKTMEQFEPAMRIQFEYRSLQTFCPGAGGGAVQIASGVLHQNAGGVCSVCPASEGIKNGVGLCPAWNCRPTPATRETTVLLIFL